MISAWYLSLPTQNIKSSSASQARSWLCSFRARNDGAGGRMRRGDCAGIRSVIAEHRGSLSVRMMSICSRAFSICSSRARSSRSLRRRCRAHPSAGRSWRRRTIYEGGAFVILIASSRRGRTMKTIRFVVPFMRSSIAAEAARVAFWPNDSFRSADPSLMRHRRR